MQKQSDEQWLALWKRLGAQGDAKAVYSDLVARYSEPHRAYHTITHIKHCLHELETIRRLITNPDVFELAIWYHDAIYDAKSKDNEEQSAALATRMVKKTLLPDHLGQSATNLIMATKHLAPPANPDAQLFVDIDLSIFGQTENDFDEYDKQIRKEYEWVAEDAFVDGRSRIVKLFLDRSNIYATRFFQNKYEAQARRNITRSLARLSNRS